MPPEITLKLSVDQFNFILQSLQAGIAWQQQNAAVLIAGLQGQAAAQTQPVNQAAPPSPPQQGNPPATTS